MCEIEIRSKSRLLEAKALTSIVLAFGLVSTMGECVSLRSAIAS